jgi:hypothetical protein
MYLMHIILLIVNAAINVNNAINAINVTNMNNANNVIDSWSYPELFKVGHLS